MKREKEEHTKSDADHEEGLGAGTDEDGEEHRVARAAEGVSVDELPSKLLLGILLAVQLVVAGNVPVEGPHQDHSDHSRQEEDNDERVHDGEPLDVRVGDRVEDVVPARRPLHIRLLNDFPFNQSSKRR